MELGYARVSTTEQNLDLQLDALNKAGCAEIFKDMLSGAKDDRPELERVLNRLRKGDALVVWRLDRLGRSLHHLIGILQELEAAWETWDMDRKRSVLKAAIAELKVYPTTSRGPVFDEDRVKLTFVSDVAPFDRVWATEQANGGCWIRWPAAWARSLIPDLWSHSEGRSWPLRSQGPRPREPEPAIPSSLLTQVRHDSLQYLTPGKHGMGPIFG